MTQDYQNGEDKGRVVMLDEARIEYQRRRDAEKPASEPILNIPPVTKILALIIIAVFLAIKAMPVDMADNVMYLLAMVPGRYTGELPFGWPAVISPVSHMFLHGGWLHLAVNIGMLTAFGAALEKALGGRRFLVVYFATGLIGALLHFAFYSHSLQPMIGASGAISGLFGAIVMWMYDSGQIGRGYKKLMPLILVWVGTSLFFGLFGMPGEDGAIAWIVHVAGFVSGLLLFRPVVRLMRRAP